jgi:hypothetical protein
MDALQSGRITGNPEVIAGQYRETPLSEATDHSG